MVLNANVLRQKQMTMIAYLWWLSLIKAPFHKAYVTLRAYIFHGNVNFDQNEPMFPQRVPELGHNA